jgi:cellulose synthase/poly-beta-1,6-N-acetylglucosamine synthase-like glycosyltransferase
MIVLLLNLIYLLIAETWLRTRQRLQLLPSPSLKESEYPSVSVVLAVRNEQENITTVLNDLLAQHYPGPPVEVIVVDDHSTDMTLIRAGELVPRIRLIRLGEDDGIGKKAALNKGIREASGTWILTTDADCRLQNTWIETLVSTGEDRYADMVCGNIKVEGGHGFLHRFQEMESAVLQVMASASLANGNPLLNNAASLAFRREAWLAVEGYEANKQVPSGDDTFLMLALHSRRPGSVVPCTRQEARVRTGTQPMWTGLFQQRLRWQSKVRYYKPGFIHLIGLLLWLSAIAIPSGCVFTFFYPGLADYLLAAVVVRIITELRMLILWRSETGQRFSLISIVGMSLFYPVFLLLLILAGICMKAEWKGRKM